MMPCVSVHGWIAGVPAVRKPKCVPTELVVRQPAKAKSAATTGVEVPVGTVKGRKTCVSVASASVNPLAMARNVGVMDAVGVAGNARNLRSATWERVASLIVKARPVETMDVQESVQVALKATSVTTPPAS